eukprot:Seg265.4 transcript_id=Seg265.4/GoldUCD/mRNA.D3Y31 product="Kinetochore-associated protein 1" protein_id=Seg265.4/GoldUCD/D3Y31
MQDGDMRPCVKMDYLRHALVVCSGVPELREIPCLAKMWRSVILAPFSSVSTPLSEDEEIACLESANLLQRCPVILDLNMQDIANRYNRIGMYTQAVSCLTLIPEVIIRDRCLKKLLEDVGCLTILDQVEKERKRGRFDGHLDHVQEEVFSYINKNKLYKEILKSAYFQKFVDYLVNSDQLNDLLMQTIISGRYSQRSLLVDFSIMAEKSNVETVIPDSDVSSEVSSEVEREELKKHQKAMHIERSITKEREVFEQQFISVRAQKIKDLQSLADQYSQDLFKAPGTRVDARAAPPEVRMRDQPTADNTVANQARNDPTTTAHNMSFAQVAARPKEKTFNLIFGLQQPVRSAKADKRKRPRTVECHTTERDILQSDILGKLRKKGLHPSCIQKLGANDFNITFSTLAETRQFSEDTELINYNWGEDFSLHHHSYRRRKKTTFASNSTLNMIMDQQEDKQMAEGDHQETASEETYLTPSEPSLVIDTDRSSLTDTDHPVNYDADNDEGTAEGKKKKQAKKRERKSESDDTIKGTRKEKRPERRKKSKKLSQNDKTDANNGKDGFDLT